jgi:nitrate reductase (cytochrome), electron transfer subunit
MRSVTLLAVAAALAVLALIAVHAVHAQEPGMHDDDGPVDRIEQSIDPLRRNAPLTSEPPAAPMARVENVDLRRKRGWPEQPPTIPHTIDGYQLDKNSNRCMVCHSRAAAEQFQAPMISITHFMDRNGQMLAQLSPRRYFCNACHVVQTDAQPLVGNDFIDIDEVLNRAGAR